MSDGVGTAVHAASFIRLRRIILEEELLAQSDLFRLILCHELFHFVWVRLGNPARNSFHTLLEHEYRAAARGELGESASVRKELLKNRLEPFQKSFGWREYACESFCDTAAWFHFRDVPDLHRSLAARWWKQRERWCDAHLRRPLAC